MNKILTYNQFLVESFQHQLILEGGAAGHMAHPFDNMDLTFGDFKKIIEFGLRGELNFEEEPTEKTDGQNLLVTVIDGQVRFARNKTTLKYPMNLRDFKQKFSDHPSQMVKETFQRAAEDLSRLLIRLPKNKLELFENGLNFMNMELIYSKNPNVIHYDRDVIQFHGMLNTDGEGNITSENPKAGKELANLLQKINANIGKTFTVIPPQVIQLGKDIDFEKNKSKFISKLKLIQNKFGLRDDDDLTRYHEMWWREEIEKSFPSLQQDIKEGLMLRWAFGDKKTLNMRKLESSIGKELASKIKSYDKLDLKKKQKENMRPLEDLFLELGSVILKNASNFVAADPSSEMQRLHKQLRDESEKIKKGGSEDQIRKVASELERLNRIGGIESIIPTEGIVFRYKGKVMKLTGTFAAINQLMGIIKYGR